MRLRRLSSFALIMSVIWLAGISPAQSTAGELVCDKLGIRAMDMTQAKKVFEARRLPQPPLKARKCVVILEVDPTGPLSKTLQPGIVLTEINAQPVTTLDVLSQLASALEVGREIVFDGYELKPREGGKPKWDEFKATVVLEVRSTPQRDTPTTSSSSSDDLQDPTFAQIRGMEAAVESIRASADRLSGTTPQRPGQVTPRSRGANSMKGGTAAAAPSGQTAKDASREHSSDMSQVLRQDTPRSNSDNDGATRAMQSSHTRQEIAEVKALPSEAAGATVGSSPGLAAKTLAVTMKVESELKIPKLAGTITCMSVSMDRKWLAVGIGGHGGSGYVIVVAADTLEQVFATPSTKRDHFRLHRGVAAVAINDERCLMWALGDGEIHLVDTVADKMLAHIPANESRTGGKCSITYSHKRQLWCVANAHGLGTVSHDGNDKKVIVNGLKSPWGELTHQIEEVGISPDGESACWFWVLGNEEQLVGYAFGLDGEKQRVFKDDRRALAQLASVAYRGEEAVLVGTALGVFQANVRTPDPLSVVAPVSDGVLDCVAGCIEPSLTFALGCGGTLFVQRGFAKDRDGLENGCQSWSDRAAAVDGYSHMAVSRDGRYLAAAHGGSGVRVFSVEVK